MDRAVKQGGSAALQLSNGVATVPTLDTVCGSAVRTRTGGSSVKRHRLRLVETTASSETARAGTTPLLPGTGSLGTASLLFPASETHYRKPWSGTRSSPAVRPQRSDEPRSRRRATRPRSARPTRCQRRPLTYNRVCQRAVKGQEELWSPASVGLGGSSTRLAGGYFSGTATAARRSATVWLYVTASVACRGSGG